MPTSAREGPEVPEGKVLVDEADLRDVTEWAMRSTTMPIMAGPTRTSYNRLVAALPAPEWEPSDELVERYQSEFDAYQADIGLPVRVRGSVNGWLKRLHAAGLLNPEVTDG